MQAHLPFSKIMINIGQMMTCTQHAMPFGAISAVYAWDRVGSALTEILRQCLLLPVDRYVDDLFWPDWEVISMATRSLVLRLMDHIGFHLDPEKTAVPSSSMDLLGITISLSFRQEALEVQTKIDAAKAMFWLDQINEILSEDVVNPRSLKVGRKAIFRLFFCLW